ncbi:MAG: hypothetical protein QOI55_1787 [Actinomycetota bacterium]|nr:hypothetical protein [Actinomycetota bacterium]
MGRSDGTSTRRAPSIERLRDQTDHLHTATPSLAGFASTVASTQPATFVGIAGASRRLLRAAVVLIALTALGGALLASRPAGAAAATSNTVTSHGAPVLGSPPPNLAQPSVGIASTPSHQGYWVVARDGGVFAFGDAKFYGSTGGTLLARPIVGIAPTPTGNGYWLVADDGGVFSFGDAHFFGSLGATRLAAPITAIAATPTGGGYWLAANDGGVFAFGDANFHGSTGNVALRSPVVGITATPRGAGYLLVADDGGVFAFGDAEFAGSKPNAASSPAVGIAAGPSGSGYVIAQEDGHVLAFGTPYHGDGAGIGDSPVVGIASSPDGYWLAHGAKPAADLSQLPFLVCTRRHESDTSGGYHAASASGTYRGAYQFSRSTWDNTARRAGRLDLVGVDPAVAAPADQDFLAYSLYTWQGAAPWGGRCS